MMARRTTRDERGLTMTEMLVTLTIMGLIALPLVTILYQSFKFAPEANARIDQASDRYFLGDSFTQDTTNAAAATVYATDGVTPQNTDVKDGSQSTTLSCTARSATTLLKLSVSKVTAGTWSTNDVLYQVAVGDDVNGWRPVAVTRVNTTPKTVTVGYCASSATNVVTASTFPKTSDCKTDPMATCGTLLHRTVGLRLSLSNRPGDDIESVDFQGAFGQTQ